MEHVTIIDGFAKLIENHGALIVFAIFSGYLNIHLFVQLARGKLIPKEVYDALESDRDRLQGIMDKDREKFMDPLLSILAGLKKDETKGGGTS